MAFVFMSFLKKEFKELFDDKLATIERLLVLFQQTLSILSAG